MRAEFVLALLCPILLLASSCSHAADPGLKAWLDAEVTDPAALKPEGKPALTELRVDLARGGEAFKLLYLTADGPLAPTFELAGDGPLRLREAFWVRDHLLTPVAEAKPAAAERSGIFWLWFETARDAKASEGRCEVVIHNGSETLRLPLFWRVHAWREPSHPRLSLTSYSLSIGVFGAYPGIITDPAANRQSMDVVEALAGASGDTLDISPYAPAIWGGAKIMATGQPLYEAIEKSPELFRTRDLPVLDFSALSPFIEQAILAGLGRCIVHSSPVDGAGGDVPQRILGKDASPGQADHDRILVWLLSELRRYLEQRGFAEEIGRAHV